MNAPRPPATPYCADIAREHPASLIGSASRARVWLMLEVTDPWRAEATSDNNLPADVQAWLDAQTAHIDDGRVLFIRQFGRTPRLDGYTLYVAVSAESDQRLYHFNLKRYRDLLGLDVAALVAGTAHQAALSNDPLTLVCTNGKRDRCCARHGAALYRALLDQGMRHVWQSTHLGGHRFAAVSAWFPEGVYLGLLGPQDASLLADARSAGTLPLAHFRGRTYYEPVAQAADAFVRRKRELTAVDAVAVSQVMALEDAIWQAECVAAGERLIVTMAREVGPPLLVSCTAPKEKPDVRFRFVACHSAE